jgi:hypothetical protein
MLRFFGRFIYRFVCKCLCCRLVSMGTLLTQWANLRFVDWGRRCSMKSSLTIFMSRWYSLLTLRLRVWKRVCVAYELASACWICFNSALAATNKWRCWMHEFNLTLKTFKPGNPKSFGACTDENILSLQHLLKAIY